MDERKKRILIYGVEGFREEQQKIERQKVDQQQQDFVNALHFAFEVGLLLVLPIAGGVLLGVWLDSKFGSHPNFTLSLLFLGLIVGVYNLFKQLSALQ